MMALETGYQILDRQDVTPDSFHASNVLDATHAILAALNCPPKVRPMISALFAQTAGRTRTISFTRADVARRLYGGPSALPADDLARACQRVTDDLGRMADWVHSEGLGDVIKYTPGTKDAPGRIQTRLVGWVADLATAADGALSPTAEDRERRAHFRKGAQEMVGKRLRRRAPSPSGRPKRKPTRGAILRQGLSLLRAYVQLSASFGQDVETATGFLHNEIDRVMSSLCQVISCEETAPDEPPNDTLATPKKGDGGNGKNLTEKRNTCQENSGQDEQEGRVQGGGSMPAVARFDAEPPPTQGAGHFDAMAADCGAMAGSVVDGPADEPDAPPLAPILDGDLASILAAASGRTEEHWRALYAAASVGSVPTAVCIGGNGERGSGRQGWRIGEDDSTDVKRLRAFLRGFDGLAGRARKAGHSLILSFDAPLLIRDDCTLADAQRLRDLALIVTETSPGNHHVFLAVEGIDTKERMTAFHAALDARGIGGNGRAGRSARWAGTWNAKRGCDVRLVHSNPGRVLTVEELQGLGIVLPAALPAEPLPTHRGADKKLVVRNLAQPRGASWRTWPSYQKALDDKGGDRSAADASFFRRSWNQGFDEQEIVDRLMSVSDRAQQRGRRAIGQELQHLVKGTR